MLICRLPRVLFVSDGLLVSDDHYLLVSKYFSNWTSVNVAFAFNTFQWELINWQVTIQNSLFSTRSNISMRLLLNLDLHRNYERYRRDSFRYFLRHPFFLFRLFSQLPRCVTWSFTESNLRDNFKDKMLSLQIDLHFFLSVKFYKCYGYDLII